MRLHFTTVAIGFLVMGAVLYRYNLLGFWF